MKYSWLLFVVSFVLAFSGCDRNKDSDSMSVAIVDLDLIAKRLGRDAQMKQSIEQRQLNLNQQIQSVQSSFLEQLKTKQSEFGDSPSEEQSGLLLAMQREANLKLNSVRQQAQGNMTQFEQSVINQFREEAKPIAQKLAAKKGCKIVLTKNDTVIFSFDSVVDITEDVVAQMKESARPSTPASNLTSSGTPSGPNARTASNPTSSIQK
jgi:Skp family chaperone for outer membrane proteins